MDRSVFNALANPVEMGFVRLERQVAVALRTALAAAKTIPADLIWVKIIGTVLRIALPT